MSKLWAYHETKEPIILEDEEFESYKNNGWYDSPIHFIKISDHGIDVDDPTAVQNFGEAIEGVKNSMNSALNIDDMDKDDLIDYALEHHGCELDSSRRLNTLRNQTYTLVYGE